VNANNVSMPGPAHDSLLFRMGPGGCIDDPTAVDRLQDDNPSKTFAMRALLRAAVFQELGAVSKASLSSPSDSSSSVSCPYISLASILRALSLFLHILNGPGTQARYGNFFGVFHQRFQVGLYLPACPLYGIASSLRHI